MAIIEIINSVYKSDKRNIDNSLEELKSTLKKDFENKFLNNICETIKQDYLKQYNVDYYYLSNFYNYLDGMDFSWQIKQIIVNGMNNLQNNLEEEYNTYYRNISRIINDASINNEDKLRKIKTEAYKFEDVLDFYQKKSNIGTIEEMGFVASRIADKFEINNDNFIYDVQSFLRKEEGKYEELVNEKISNIIYDIKDKFIINSKKMLKDLEFSIENTKENNVSLVEQVNLMVNEVIKNYKSKGEISFEEMEKIWNTFVWEHYKQTGRGLNSKEKEILILGLETIKKEGITILPKQNQVIQDKVEKEPSLPKENFNPIGLVNENKLKENIELSNEVSIPFKQYLEEFFAPYMPNSDIVSLSEGKQISTKEYLETLVFENASKYGRNVENLVSDIKNNRLNSSPKTIKNKEFLIEKELKRMLNVLSAQSINNSMNKFEELIDKTTNNMLGEIKSNISFTPEQEVYVNKAIDRLNMNLKTFFVKVLHNMQKTFETINDFIMVATKQTDFNKDNVSEIKEICEAVTNLKSYSVGLNEEFIVIESALISKIKADTEQKRYLDEIFTMDIVDFDNYNNQLFNEIQNSIMSELSNILNTSSLVYEELKSADYPISEEQVKEMMEDQLEELKRNNNGVKR